MSLYWVRLYGGHFTCISAWISCNNLRRLVSHNPSIFFKLVGKNEIQRYEVTLLSHRASNCTRKHPNLPVLEHSTILLSSYMFLDLPLWKLGPLQKRSQLNGAGRCTCITLAKSVPIGPTHCPTQGPANSSICPAGTSRSLERGSSDAGTSQNLHQQDTGHCWSWVWCCCAG